MIAFWNSPTCGCGTGKQIIWREPLSAPPSGGGASYGFLKFIPFADTYTVQNNSGAISVLGWEGSGTFAAGDLVKKLTTYTPALTFASQMKPSERVDYLSQAVAIYQVVTPIASGAGDPETDPRFQAVGFTGESMHRWDTKPLFVSGDPYESGAMARYQGAGKICQQSNDGQATPIEPGWYNYPLNREALARTWAPSDAPAGAFQSWSETTSWAWTIAPYTSSWQPSFVSGSTGSFSRFFSIVQGCIAVSPVVRSSFKSTTNAAAADFTPPIYPEFPSPTIAPGVYTWNSVRVDLVDATSTTDRFRFVFRIMFSGGLGVFATGDLTHEIQLH